MKYSGALFVESPPESELLSDNLYEYLPYDAFHPAELNIDTLDNRRFERRWWTAFLADVVHIRPFPTLPLRP